MLMFNFKGKFNSNGEKIYPGDMKMGNFQGDKDTQKIIKEKISYPKFQVLLILAIKWTKNQI